MLIPLGDNVNISAVVKLLADWGCPTRASAIRFWESCGHIESTRTDGNHRRYSRLELQKIYLLALMKRAKRNVYASALAKRIMDQWSTVDDSSVLSYQILIKNAMAGRMEDHPLIRSVVDAINEAIEYVEILRSNDKDAVLALLGSVMGLIHNYNHEVGPIVCPKCGNDQEYSDHSYSDKYTEYYEFYHCNDDDCDGPPMKATFGLVKIGEAE